MPNPRSAGKNENDADNDQMMEAELSKLINHHRVIDKDRTAYQHDAMERIRIQTREIELLEKEKEEHLKNLKLSESDANVNKNKEKQDELRSLVEERDAIEEEIELFNQEERKMEAELKRAEKQLKDRFKESGGASGSSEGARQRANKQIRTLENKLDNTLKKFSDQLAMNQELRKKVESARYEKTRFEQVYKKLEEHNEAIRIEMGKIIELSNQAYDQREEAQNKIISGKEKADKEEAQNQSEMRELQRSIDHEKKLREFMDIKKSEREEDEFTKAHKKKKEEELREKKAREGQKDTAEIYERAMREIREITGEESDENLDAVVNKFIENEDRNFALFNYINDQNNRIEAYRDEIDKVDRDKSRFQQNEENLDKERQTKLQEIESRQALVSKMCEDGDQKLKLNDKILDQLKKAIQSIFEKIDCPRESIEDLLGSAAGIKENNMMQYLGIVEERTNELLRIKSYVDYKDQDKQDSAPGDFTTLGLLGDGPRAPAPKAEIIAPSTGDGFSDEGSDDEVKPLSVDELRQRALKNVAKKERELAKTNTQSEFQTSEKKRSNLRKK